MKKKIFIKFFILVTMVLFTISACQNDDVNVDESGEMSKAKYSALINTLKTRVNDSINANVKTLTNKLNEDKVSLRSGTNDEALQKEIIGTALQIEVLNAYKNNMADYFVNLAAVPPTDCGFSALQGLNNNDFITSDIVYSIHWTGFVYYYLEDFPLVNKDNLFAKFNALLNAVKNCNFATNNQIEDLQSQITTLLSTVQTHINLVTGILDIVNGESQVINDIYDYLYYLDNYASFLDEAKADKFTLNEKLYNLIDVYNELIQITDALNLRLTQAEADIDDLQARVAYIEDTEIPAIWEGISILYKYISDVYSNLDQRVTGLTYKPDYDFGPSLSSLILVRGINEWETKNIQGGFGWKKKDTGSVYKGITYLNYDVSPANAELDLETLELLYKTTTLITRSSSDPLMKIVTDDPQYPITYMNGVLRVPVAIHSDAYPLLQTSFDLNSTQNIKVALQVKNKGITAPEEPTRPEQGAVVPTATTNGTEDTNRSVVSSEYVTVWMGLFDGRIAEKDAVKTHNIGLIFPTEIKTADFLKKDCSTINYPLVTLWVGQNKPNTVTIADSVLAVFYDQFEKAYRLPADYLFEKHNLSFELVDLGNNANNLVTFDPTNGKIDVSQQDRAAATGKTLAVLVKTKVGNVIHALGYVRVIIAAPEKELIVITNNFALNPITINCSAWTEFTSRNAVSGFVNSNIINNTVVNQKTNISTLSAFYQKYTDIEINSVNIVNADATLPNLTPEELKAMVTFEYITSGSPYYIKGSLSNLAPLGNYTVVTTLKSNEYIPDLQITWTFTTRIPKLKPTSLLLNNQLLITLPTPSTNVTASYSSVLNEVFQRNQNGVFIYDNLNGQNCDSFIVPNFIFDGVPSGYVISPDGRSVSKNNVVAGVIEDVNGLFTIRLIEGPAAYGLIGSNEVLVKAIGSINGGIYITYPSFNVIFIPPLLLALPENASFYRNQYTFGLYAFGYSGMDVIRSWNNMPIALKNDKEGAKLLIDYYGINYMYDQTYRYSNSILSSPIKMDLTNITYASGSSNTFNTLLSSLGVSVTIGQFIPLDVMQFYNLLTPLRYTLMFNTNGATLPANMRIAIPVSMEHRWGMTEGNLVIKVN